MVLDQPPIRLCCMQRHYGSVCPDGKVMCCICFDRFAVEDLAVDPRDGKRWDVCDECADQYDERQRILAEQDDD